MALRCAFSTSLRPLLSRQHHALRFIRSSAGRSTPKPSSAGSPASAAPNTSGTPTSAAGKTGAGFQHPLLGGVTAGAALFLLWCVLPKQRAKAANPLGTWGVDRDDSVLRFGDSRSSEAEPQQPLQRSLGEKDGWRVVQDGDGVKKMEFDDGRGNKGFFISRSWGSSMGPDGKVITFGNGAPENTDGFPGDISRLMEEQMKQFDQLFRGGLFGAPMFPRLFGSQGDPFEAFFRPGVRLTPVPSQGGTGGIHID